LRRWIRKARVHRIPAGLRIHRGVHHVGRSIANDHWVFLAPTGLRLPGGFPKIRPCRWRYCALRPPVYVLAEKEPYNSTGWQAGVRLDPGAESGVQTGSGRDPTARDNKLCCARRNETLPDRRFVSSGARRPAQPCFPWPLSRSETKCPVLPWRLGNRRARPSRIRHARKGPVEPRAAAHTFAPAGARIPVFMGTPITALARQALGALARTASHPADGAAPAPAS
jgi:hypothetical protein